ncbi:hypothetical protein NIES4075_25840 [Tolypothrix sp. NIES-4075]|nr:hypothetical protein NIES4075_25840 [Tolypothrix sp. NIES-4075]
MGNGEWVMVSQRGLGGLPHERLANPEGGNGEWGMGNGEWGMGNGEKEREREGFPLLSRLRYA